MLCKFCVQYGGVSLRAESKPTRICLQALHRVLRGLPSTLALANGHSAALEATDELRQEMSATDARRLDKLFRLVSGDDSSCTGLRAIVGPLFL